MSLINSKGRNYLKYYNVTTVLNISGGENRINIFTNDIHREMFLKTLLEVSTLFKIEVHGYCLMDNHYHLLLKTPYPNLSKVMRHLSSLYTLRFNRATNRDGPLFRGRYKAILIEVNTYLLRVSRYIHLNPIEAKIVEHPVNFHWSSYKEYMGVRQSSWMHTSFIMDFFKAEKNYDEFISEGIDLETSNFYNRSQLAPVIGKAKFIVDKIRNLKNEYKVSTQSDVNLIKKLLNIDDIAVAVINYFNITMKELKFSGKNNHSARLLAMYLIRNMAQASHQKISEYFTGIKRVSVSAALIKCRRWIDTDLDAKEQYLRLVQIIEESQNGI